MRGRKPHPTALKILNGNPGKRPLNEFEPEVSPEIPEMPPHLDELAQQEWERVTQELHSIGVLGQVDRAALAAYCVAWSRWVQAEMHVAEQGFILTGQNNGGPYQNPMLAVANKALEQIQKFSAEFGMTPSSRTRLKVSPSEQKNQSSVLDFVNARKQG